MGSRACEVEGCGRRATVKGRCATHDQRDRRSSVEAPRCEVPGCERPTTVKGRCATHDLRVRSTGDVDADRPIAPYRWWTAEEDAQIVAVLAAADPPYEGRVERGAWSDVGLILDRSRGLVAWRATYLRKRRRAAERERDHLRHVTAIGA